jgi:hypothetical protein
MLDRQPQFDPAQPHWRPGDHSSGCRLGQDGFGYVLGRSHAKVPQIGRVIVQDDVEIGAGSTIDRGANRDTVIGEGTNRQSRADWSQPCHRETLWRMLLF